jgi:branched-chain amino acid transport system substrate-binding protein
MPIRGHRHRRKLAWLVAFLTAAMFLAACGPRKPHGDYLAAAGGGDRQSSNRSGRLQPGSTGGGNGTTSDSGAGADQAAGPSATGGDAGTGGGPAGGGAAAGGGGGGGRAGGGGGQSVAANTASDVGVTADSILVGNITSVGGPLGPNVFSPAYYGANAYFRALNDKGGINGRQIKFVTCDDKEDPNQDLQCAQGLVERQKIFAFVANNTRVENGAANYINGKGVPVVGDFCIGNWCIKYPHYWSNFDTHYPRDGKSIGVDGKAYTQDGQFKWLKENTGVTKAAVFFYSIAISRQAGLQWAAALKRQGIDVVYYGGGSDQGENPASPTYDTDVIQMRNKGVDMVVNAIDMNGFQKLCQSMDRYNFTVKVNLGNPQAFGDVVGDFSSPCRNNVYSFDSMKSYADTNDPQVGEMAAAMKKYYPNVQMHQWVLTGWAAAKMFADGVKSLGPNVTRAGLEKWLAGLKGYDNGGLSAPHDFAWPYDYSKPAKQCFSIAKWDESAKHMKTQAPISTCYNMPYVAYTPLDDGS